MTHELVFERNGAKQEVDIEGETVSLDIPMTVEFFWPKTGR